ncbi:MAG: hypothetical protein VXX95_05015 [Candidatus Thermoplasmatota archaeon]|nr:hypothetical protein [Candidatus Thermoplasmatota archaeon]
MVDVGELIGGIMSGITRARRDADMTAAMIAEEYKLNSLLSQVAAPRVRLAGIEVDLPVILNTAQGASTRKSGGSAITSQGVLQVLSTRLQEEQVSAELLTRFQTYAGRDLDILFGGEVSGISGEAISQIAQQSFTKALNESTAAPEGREKEPERGAKGGAEASEPPAKRKAGGIPTKVDPPAEVDTNKGVDGDRVRSILELESRRLGREMVQDLPVLDVIAETEMIKSLGSDAAVTRLKIKLLEEGLEWTTMKDEDGNRVSRLTSE